MQDVIETPPAQSNRLTPVLVKFERKLIEESDRVANERFEGNRSLLIRTAVRELIERVERQKTERFEVTA